MADPNPIPKPAPVGTIYALPSATNGVAMNPPPLSLLPSISAAVAKACESIPPGKHGALVGVATKNGDQTNVNLAVVTRIGDNLAITGWIGRSWGSGKETSEVGAQVSFTF